MINPSNFKAYDIRGIYPTDINENNFPDIIKAIYSFFVKDLPNKNISVVLGRDMRLAGPSLFEVAKKTLVDCGAKVIDIGLTSTPTMYYAVFKYQSDVGIQITASHNPKEWTGVKFLKRNGDKALKISKDTGMEEVKQRAMEQDFILSDKKGEIIQITNTLVDEVKDAIAKINPPNNRRLKIVSDTANGMGALYLKEIFKNFAVDWIKLNYELDGSFPNHQADPLQFELLKDLQKKVIEEKADFGIAPDGDGDRVFFVNEKGDIIPATMITSLIASEILKDQKGQTIVADIRYTRNVQNLVKKMGGLFSISKVGHALITKQLNDTNAVFAGESSGHFYFKDTGGAESSIRVILYVLKAIEEENKSISEILKEFETSIESGEYNFVLPDGTNAKKLSESIANSMPKGNISWLDGLSIDYPDWRLNIRTSNTEPLLRLNVEGDNNDLVQNKFKLLSDKIVALGGKPKISH